MNLLFALAVGVLFAVGVYLLQKRDLIRVVLGINLISNATILFIIAASLSRGLAPILPESEQPSTPAAAVYSDPLMQALVLTAVVIGFGITALLLILVYRIYTSHDALDQEALREDEIQEVAQLEQEPELS